MTHESKKTAEGRPGVARLPVCLHEWPDKERWPNNHRCSLIDGHGSMHRCECGQEMK
jgi:hypothetical protein